VESFCVTQTQSHINVVCLTHKAPIYRCWLSTLLYAPLAHSNYRQSSELQAWRKVGINMIFVLWYNNNIRWRKSC